MDNEAEFLKTITYTDENMRLAYTGFTGSAPQLIELFMKGRIKSLSDDAKVKLGICLNCESTERAAIFKGMPYCCDNCRKALGVSNESERKHNELNPQPVMRTELEERLIEIVGFLSSNFTRGNRLLSINPQILNEWTEKNDVRVTFNTDPIQVNVIMTPKSISD